MLIKRGGLFLTIKDSRAFRTGSAGPFFRSTVFKLDGKMRECKALPHPRLFTLQVDAKLLLQLF